MNGSYRRLFCAIRSGQLVTRLTGRTRCGHRGPYPEPVDVAAEKAILGEDATIDLLNVLGMLRRRKWLIMLVTALGHGRCGDARA